ncbi:MAG: S-methyl-5'-thioadenosine phosphorylase [Pseudomonadota bacterium]
MRRKIGFIGGSGIYEADGLEGAAWTPVETPWGTPSDAVLTGAIAGVDVAFLPRHGRGHRLPPSSVNYRANIDALKRLGVTDVVSISACGSFREELSPGTFVIVDQFIDRTSGREASFFGPGCVAHVSMAEPVCPVLGDALAAACASLDIPHRRGGVYLAINGPQFSSKAESHLYRAWGCDVIGMTNMPEAKLAREAELPYATLAMVTDSDCWREGDAAVDVASVIAVMQQNSRQARRLIGDLAARLGPERTPCPLGVETALDAALITPPEARDPALLAKLGAIAGRVLGAA